ncbi:MAG: 50S ribosomal protein L23 [Patescibacteria group bacterium]
MSILDRFKKPSAGQATAEPVKQSPKETAKVKVEPKKKTVAAETDKPKEAKKLEAEKTEESEKKPKAEVVKIYNVLIRPLVTEKVTNLNKFNKYVFAVAEKANKIQIAQAILSRYGVKPLRVNVLNYAGKKVRYGRSAGKMKNWRKAVITLPEGKSIDIYGSVK